LHIEGDDMELGKAGRETVVIHSVERELLLPAAEPDEAWDLVSDPERLGDWLGGDVEMDPVPGGEFRIRFDGDGGERIGFVEELDADSQRFAFWWRRPEDELSTRVEISLEQTEEGTLVRVVETSPMATLDCIGIPLPGRGAQGPTALAFAFA
jgi:uncharacterized protein YndB with AHSA1/START domain